MDAFDTAAESGEDLIDLPDELEFNVSQPVEESAAEEPTEALAAANEADDLEGLSLAEEEPAPASAAESADDEDYLDDFFVDDDLAKDDDSAPLADVNDAELRPLTDEPLEVDTGENKLNLETFEPDADEEADTEIDSELENMLQSVAEETEESVAADQPEEDSDDLDSLLASLDSEDETQPAATPTPGQLVEEELTANIAHDLDTDLGAEIDDLLDSTDDEIALEEESAEELFGQESDPLDSLNLLEGADEIETKLDLARAYIEMEDAGGARDILNEIISEGNPQQRTEAQRLLDTLE